MGEWVPPIASAKNLSNNLKQEMIGRSNFECKQLDGTRNNAAHSKSYDCYTQGWIPDLYLYKT